MAKTSASEELPLELRKELLYKMILGRTFEDQVYYLFLRGVLPGTVHQSQGQEATAVGVGTALRTDDLLIAHHRPHNIALAKGLSPKAAMAELFGRSSGCCGGKGGSMHLGDISVGMVPSLAIVGASITIAPGIALAFKMQGSDRIAVSVFGDGATNEGAFHEGVNFAAVRHLPCVFVCENNLYGASTSFAEVSLVTNVAERACAYGIPGETADGMDVIAVFTAMRRAVARARAGQGPTLLELKTYRFAGHSRNDAKKYRPEGEEEKWRERDPIHVLSSRLLASGEMSEEAVKELQARAAAEVEEAIAYAQEESAATADEAFTGVFRLQP